MLLSTEMSTTEASVLSPRSTVINHYLPPTATTIDQSTSNKHKGTNIIQHLCMYMHYDYVFKINQVLNCLLIFTLLTRFGYVLCMILAVLSIVLHDNNGTLIDITELNFFDVLYNYSFVHVL